MNAHEWTWRCAERLHEQWPRVDRVDLEHLAEALRAEERWQSMEPTEAALAWLTQGIPLQQPNAESTINTQGRR
jgi:hypothetical protein